MKTDRLTLIEYYLFRPEHDQVLMQLVEKRQAGEEPDREEVLRLRCFGLLMVASDGRDFGCYAMPSPTNC